MATYADKLDCGHSVLGRSSVHYCGDCLERIVREKEAALALVKARDATIAELADDIRLMVRQEKALRDRIDALEDVDYRDSD